jgi:hypothetical protein
MHLSSSGLIITLLLTAATLRAQVSPTPAPLDGILLRPDVWESKRETLEPESPTCASNGSLRVPRLPARRCRASLFANARSTKRFFPFAKANLPRPVSPISTVEDSGALREGSIRRLSRQRYRGSQ